MRLLGFLLLLLSTADAGNGSAFEGDWVLDSRASHSWDRLGPGSKSIVGRFAPCEDRDKFRLAQKSVGMAIQPHSSQVDRPCEQRIHVGNAPYRSTTTKGEHVEIRSNWEGQSLVTTYESHANDGTRVHLTLRRSLEGNGSTLREVLFLERTGQGNKRIDRLFTRKTEEGGRGGSLYR